MNSSKQPRHIERNGYHAIDWRGSSVSITELWHRYPELVIGRYLVNTSFDSGFLTLGERERAQGWRKVGNLAHSPCIRALEGIPHDQFDEWLIFEEPVQVENFETMVNYYGFTPIDFDWEKKRERFWEQVVGLRPLHVMGENDNLYLVSRDDDVVCRVIGGVGGSPEFEG